MSVCLYICACALPGHCVPLCLWMFLYICVNLQSCVCWCICLHTCVSVLLYICVSVPLCVSVSLCVCMCKREHGYTYVSVYMCMRVCVGAGVKAGGRSVSGPDPWFLCSSRSIRAQPPNQVGRKWAAREKRASQTRSGSLRNGAV